MALIRFIETKHYAWFTEFCDTCRNDRIIGICYGRAGVGKTLSARRYTQWDIFESLPQRTSYNYVAPDNIQQTRAIYYCPDVLNSAGSVRRDIARLRKMLRHMSTMTRGNAEKIVAKLGAPEERKGAGPAVERPAWWWREHAPSTFRVDILGELVRRSELPDPTELIIVDEADRLKMASLEQIRSIYDEGGIGVVLIGPPEFEKQLSRFAQLYSRVGYVQEFMSLSQEDMIDVLVEKLELGDYGLPEGALRNKDVLAAIVRTTRGNFRLLSRLLMQVRRIMEINRLDEASREVIEAARETLVIGSD